MRRRDFTTLVGSSTLWPLTTRAQQAAKMLRVGTAKTMNLTLPPTLLARVDEEVD